MTDAVEIIRWRAFNGFGENDFGPVVHLRFVDLFPAVDDVLVYIGSSRLQWETIQESLVYET